MAKAYLDRIEALRKRYFETRVDMDVYNAKYLTEGFKDSEGQPWIIQKATGFRNQCLKKNIYILDNELLVGGAAFKPRAGILCADSSCSILDRELDTISTRKFDPFYLSEEGKKIFKEEVSEYWKNKCLLDRWRIMAPEDMEILRDSGMIYIDRKAVRGYGETTPGWTTLLKKGIGGIKKEAEEKLAQLDDSKVGDLEKMIFLKAEIIAAEGIIALANRHADLAEQMAAECTDEKRKAELLKIAEVNRRVPEHPARTFYEAVQSMLTYEYAIYMEQNASSYNLGRIDQYLYPYYKADVEAGILDDDGAQELLDCMWIKIAELSLFQDEITAQFAAGYCITVQVSAGGIDQYGNMKQYTDMADINMGGIVEMALNNGVSRKTGQQVSVQTGDPRDFKTFDEFFEAIKAHIRHFVDVVVSGDQLLDYLSMNYRPVPTLSLTYPNCMETLVDYSNGGAKYNCGGGVITVGQADIINSIAAVKYLVYDEKKITMDELCKALDANFEGYEEIHQMCMDAPKYGNDDERADFSVGEIFTYVTDEFEKYNTKFGKMTTGMLPVSGNTPIGEWVGALPSGRYAGTPLTDGIGATGGTDVNGPTALLKSVSHIPHARFTQGTQLNMKLEPSMLQGEEGLHNMMNMLKTQCTLDIYHSQFNVVDKEILLDAQAHPENHKDLLIRVAGYTAFFVELGKEVQDEIIGRTEIGAWNGCCGA